MKFVLGLILTVLSLFLEGIASGRAVIYTVTGDNLNVRSGPGTNYRVMGQLMKGDTVEMVWFYDQDWAEIRYKGGKGYVSRHYIEYKSQMPEQRQERQFISQDTLSTVGSILGKIWKILKWILIAGLFWVALAFKDELIEVAIYLGSFAGIGALVTYLFFRNGTWGAIIGFIVAVVIVLRYIIDLEDVGSVIRFLLVSLYYVVSFPFYVSNQLQYFLSEPWRGLFRNHNCSDKTNRILRPVFEVLKVLLYIVLIPLRTLNAVYYNIVVHWLAEMYDFLLEVFMPCNEIEGADNFLRWLLMLPWRILRYPLFHGVLTLLESVIWTVIDVFYPAITLYHGTDLTAGQSIAGSRHRNRSLNWKSGTFLASQSSWGGIGVYFAASRSVALRYAHDPYRLSDRDPIVLVCRVSPGRIINYSLAPWYVFDAAGGDGHPPTINNYAEQHHYTTGEWWNGQGHYWEYCLFDWQNRYNHPWRIRPIYIFNNRTKLIQHIKGGMAHWLFKF